MIKMARANEFLRRSKAAIDKFKMMKKDVMLEEGKMKLQILAQKKVIKEKKMFE